MSADEFDSAVNRLSAMITDQLPAINEKMALDASAMVKDRILNTGIKADGSSLGEYSDNRLPTFFFKDKELNKAGENFYLSRKKKDAKNANPGISYKEWREANNRPTDHVTLSFSGTTLRDVGVIKQLVSGARISTAVGPKNTKLRGNGDTTEKITDEYLAPRYGNFMEPNSAEKEKLKTYLTGEVNKIINETFR